MITTCERCGATAATHRVLLRGNLGLVVVRWVTRIEGSLCSRCIEETGVRMSTFNMMGFAGVVSLFTTPYYALANWRQVRRARAALGPPAPIDRKSVRREAAIDALFHIAGLFGGKGKAAAGKAVDRLEQMRRARELPQARVRELPDGERNRDA